MFKPSLKARDSGLLLSAMMLFTVMSSGVPQVQTTAAPVPVSEISGMYSFEREGEFVQINVEQPTKNTGTRPLAVTGFISRFGDSESDRGAFLDYFITKGSLDGDKVTFVTKVVHGIMYEFSGKIARGSALTRDKDGYYELHGTLTQTTVVDGKPSSAKKREITMRLFPDVDHDQPKKKD